MSSETDAPLTEAFGWPGIPGRWTTSSKEGVGTAYAVSSRVWFTLSHGILNEVYYPTIDHPQTRDLELLITDGATFFHEEKRDLEHETECISPDALGYRIVNRDPEGRYEIHKEIIADPHQPCLLLRVRLQAAPEWVDRLQLYVLLAPHVEISGSGDSACRLTVAGQKTMVAWKGQTYLALGADVGFSKTSCGYVGASDGWTDLHDDYHMDWQFGCVADGNIALTGEVDLPADNEFTVGLGFGDSRHAAVSTLRQSLAVPFDQHRSRFVEQWRRVCCDVRELDEVASDGGVLYRTSYKLLLAHEDKTFPGALIASASIPWGEAKGDEDLGGYHLVWTRDMVQSATGLLACSHLDTPREALVYLACSQRADGGFPQNFWLDGTPHSSGIQLDEVALPIVLAWRLWQAGGLAEFDPYPMVRSGAAFLIRRGPMTDQERWEEASGYSPSTLASNIAALLCAASFAKDRGEADMAVFLAEYADFLETHVEQWTVTTAGSLVPDIPRHYVRINPTDPCDLSPDEDPNHGVLAVANRPPGTQHLFPARDVVDPGFLELVRYGIRKPGDPLIEDSLRVVDAVLKVDTPFGPSWRRYNHDGYGQRADGGPYLGWGQGRAWPLLTGERGHYELAAGRDVGPYVKAIDAFALNGAMIPEQVWDEDEVGGQSGLLGRPTGSAMPLMWAHAEYIKLLRSTADGQVFDIIPIVADRYLAGKGRRDLEVWKPVRQVRRIARGQVLRIQAPEAFRLHWTADDWQTVRDTDSRPTGLGIGYVDIPIASDQVAPIRFTFCWPDRQQWEGRDYVVEVAEQ